MNAYLSQQGICGDSLVFPLHFAVILKLLQNNKILIKVFVHTETYTQSTAALLIIIKNIGRNQDDMNELMNEVEFSEVKKNELLIHALM